MADDALRVPRRIGAGVLLRNRDGDVLLVEPTYKEHWEIPGGLVEAGESPREAARRECLEELGVEIDVGDPLCIDFVEGDATRSEGLMFVFDAGVTSMGVEDFTVPADELHRVVFVAPNDLSVHVRPSMADRLRRALAAAAEANGYVSYVERWRPS